jgi:hypothetical protein
VPERPAETCSSRAPTESKPETVPGSGKVGSKVNILGTGLTGVGSVTFNGTSAVFTVDSSTLITAAVPAGATSGKV